MPYAFCKHVGVTEVVQELETEISSLGEEIASKMGTLGLIIAKLQGRNDKQVDNFKDIAERTWW